MQEKLVCHCTRKKKFMIVSFATYINILLRVNCLSRSKDNKWGNMSSCGLILWPGVSDSYSNQGIPFDYMRPQFPEKCELSATGQ